MRSPAPEVDPDALLCALILSPRTFPRNRYFSLYESPAGKKIRRRATRVRGIIRQLVGEGRLKAEITGETVLEDGRYLIRYEVEGLGLHRTAALAPLEAAAFHYALHRAGKMPLDGADRRLVERTLEKLGADLVLDRGTGTRKDA
ncbi:MAG TPA: hypothetical protein VHE30_19810 [Polyangiaceae bacterium]|nr:hypothetical protein [Polyangiaceae bacterium]